MGSKQNRDKKSFLKAGEFLISKVREKEQTSINKDDMDQSWLQINRLLEETKRSRRKQIIYTAASIAASIILLFTIGSLFINKATDNESSISLALFDEIKPEESDEIRLIARNDEIILHDESVLTYESDGKLNVNKNVLKLNPSEAPVQEEVNHIIVPKGKRANVTFSDGTKMYINSGSRVIYPVVFKKDKREILVEGEIFLEVSKDSDRPFIVKTNNLDVTVLGTQFNVCAYKEDPFATVVLVSGSVEVKTGSNDKSVLEPNQLYEINESGHSISHVNVLEYISWKDNMMILSGRKAGEVFDRLSRYYGRTIIYDESIAQIPILGKLDLKEDLKESIETVCLSLLLNYSIDENNNFVITLK